MRLKKLMSLVLALAMALSLVTVASAADTEVYYIDNFDGYADITAFDAGKTVPTTWAANAIGYADGSSRVPISEAAANSANGVYGLLSDSATALTDFTKYSALTNGKLSLISNAKSASAGISITFAPKKLWDYVTNEGYTYVISYDRSWNPRNTEATTNANGSDGARLSFYNSGRTTCGLYNVFYGDLTYAGGVAGVRYVGCSSENISNSNLWSTFGDITVGTEYKYALGVKKGAKSGSYYIANRTYARDGVPGTAGSQYMAPVNQTNTYIGAFTLHDSYYSNSTIDNIRMYTIKDDSFKVTSTASEGRVNVNNKAIVVKFGNLVAADTFDKTAVVVKKGDDTLVYGDDYAVSDLADVIGSVGGEIYSTATVTFTALEEDATYEITFPETVANELGTTLGGNKTVTFTTNGPDITVNCTILSADGEKFKADNSVQGAKFELLNNTGIAKSVALIYAVYTTGGQLADVAYVNETIAAEGTTTIEAGMKLSAAGTLKTFIWDTMESLKPYTGSKEIAIDDAE